MRTNLKLAFLMTTGLALGGVAAAQGNATADQDDQDCPMHAEMKQKMLERFDANKDGKLDAQERAKAHQELATETFKKLDTNGDGQISQAEFMAGHQRMWERKNAQGQQPSQDQQPPAPSAQQQQQPSDQPSTLE